MRLALIGVPFNSAGVPDGEARAPQALREAGLFEALARFNDVVDEGDVRFGAPTPSRDPASGIIAPEVFADMVAATRAAVGRAFANDRFPIVVGGECPLLLGCLAAARDVHNRIGLLFIDGHEDAWPPERSTTGEAADMELGFALGLSKPNGRPGLEDLNVQLPLVRAEDVVVLGPRDASELADAGLPSLADQAALLAFLDDTRWRSGGVAETTRTLASRFHATAGRWWYHLDLDALASDALAAVRYPQSGGLSWAEATAATAAVLATPGLVGWNVTIYNPDLDSDGGGAARVVAFLAEAAERLARV